ncbi:hypothetical protein BKA70DRAFT_1280666 [Coprinopsis sp. MPI-PUGE-AT-0042]|nr:hypothetical protein BKA70DRAFT_1280666 [Coprinopsis sp. MPI-PUGE-AT-0042]
MALNWAMLDPNRVPVPLPDEMTITKVDSGVDLAVTIPPANSSTGASSSREPQTPVPVNTTPSFQKMKATGRAWLTDQRLIYVTEPGSSFESLSVPLHAILSTGFHQPTFGSNYLTFELKPSPDGNLTEGTSVEIRFKDRAMFEFASLLEKTREKAIYMKKQAAEEEEGLPTYTLPAESSSVTMVGGLPVENPPGYND